MADPPMSTLTEQQGSKTMKQHSPRFLIVLLIAILVVISNAVVVVLHFRGSTTPDTKPDVTISWQTSATSFTQQDQQDIQIAWKNALLSGASGK
jgi:flagellar basal body-associated protein FliL